jgi:RND family efflux transporter MFP subunit
VEVRLVGDQNLVAEGTVREISPGVDPVTRTYTVKVALIDAPPAFLLGASVVGRAKLPTQSVINLPSAALFQTAQGEPAVWVVDQPQDTVSLRPVSVLQYDTGTVTVSGGLTTGETVVVGGSQKLRPGQKVTIRQGGGA